MARPWSRKQKASIPAPAPPGEPSENVDLGDGDHAWWAQKEVTGAWRPSARKPPEQQPEARDILAEHFGDDWRTSFGFTPADEERAAEADGEPETPRDEDPYEVLGVEPAATWDEIVAAHRQQARVHHPDRLFGRSEDEKEVGDERIRILNAAYQELRIRRGR